MTRVLSFIFFLVFFKILSAQVTPAEKAALQEFYDATDGPNWASENDPDPNNDWDFTGPVTNDWFGIQIVGGHVSSIVMNRLTPVFTVNNLNGSIPEEIRELSFLTVLDLSGENLSGDLPNGLFDLTALQYLNLRLNNLSGNIPDEISQLTNLRQLQLYANDFDGEIPVSLTTLNNLEILELFNNNLTGEIPIEITQILSLKVLKLENNPFTGFMYPEYGNLINLEVFSLFGNSLTGSIPIELGNLINLKTLSLGRNQLSGTLPIELRNLTNLEFLDISVTDITGSIPDEYGELTQIQSLSLYHNQLSGVIPSSLSNLTQIRNFEVHTNQLTAELPPSFDQWILIEKFDVAGNQLSGPIPESYANLINLSSFNVRENMLSGEISPSFSNWSNIKDLNLGYNNFTGSIPDSYSNFNNLEFFNVEQNQFSGLLSTSFVNWANAKNLNFSYNEFEGPVPDFTSVLTFIASGSDGESLNIRDNKFQFGDFENEFDYYDQIIFSFSDSPQAKVNEVENLSHNLGENVTLTTTVSGAQNHYQWFKDGVPIPGSPDSPSLTLNNIQANDAGVYHVEITSDIVTDLTLVRNDITIIINCVAPTADDPVDVNACASYTLPTLSANNFYYTQTNAGGTQLNTGDVITTTQTIYVYTGASGCSDESSFDVQIDNFGQIDNIEDVVVCENYTLPTLNNGNYFTESNGTGTELFSGDIIGVSQ
ncbi:MAG: immunoglobulin domain-containing protein, partial [Maribacter sp.]